MMLLSSWCASAVEAPREFLELVEKVNNFIRCCRHGNEV